MPYILEIARYQAKILKVVASTKLEVKMRI